MLQDDTAQYDAFFSDEVEAVARVLHTRGLRVFLDRWYLTLGQPWPQALEQALAGCRALLVFLGPEGLGRWQLREKDWALERQAWDPALPVIPVLPPSADPPLGFLRLNTWVDLRRGLDDAAALRTLELAIRCEPPAPDLQPRIMEARADICPYRGLQQFREEDAPFFFGCDNFIDLLVSTVGQRSFLAVVGASGSGKSSVVRAGLFPRLRHVSGSPVWDVVSLLSYCIVISQISFPLSGRFGPVRTAALFSVKAYDGLLH